MDSSRPGPFSWTEVSILTFGARSPKPQKCEMKSRLGQFMGRRALRGKDFEKKKHF
jgi:hypothetical protein